MHWQDAPERGTLGRTRPDAPVSVMLHSELFTGESQWLYVTTAAASPKKMEHHLRPTTGRFSHDAVKIVSPTAPLRRMVHGAYESPLLAAFGAWSAYALLGSCSHHQGPPSSPDTSVVLSLLRTDAEVFDGGVTAVYHAIYGWVLHRVLCVACLAKETHVRLKSPVPWRNRFLMIVRGVILWHMYALASRVLEHPARRRDTGTRDGQTLARPTYGQYRVGSPGCERPRRGASAAPNAVRRVPHLPSPRSTSASPSVSADSMHEGLQYDLCLWGLQTGHHALRIALRWKVLHTRTPGLQPLDLSHRASRLGGHPRRTPGRVVARDG